MPLPDAKRTRQPDGNARPSGAESKRVGRGSGLKPNPKSEARGPKEGRRPRSESVVTLPSECGHKCSDARGDGRYGCAKRLERARLAALSSGAGAPKAGASSTHSQRFTPRNVRAPPGYVTGLRRNHGGEFGYRLTP